MINTEQLLTELDRWPDDSSRAQAAATIRALEEELRSEQSTRREAEASKRRWFERGAVWAGQVESLRRERDELQRRINVVLELAGFYTSEWVYVVRQSTVREILEGPEKNNG
jgi:hypothetical protein